MSVEEAAERLASSEFVRIATHADADGVASAACLCSSLSSLGIGYHFTALEEPSNVVEVDADVFCDLGAAYLDRIDDAVVIDHHPPSDVEGFDGVLVGTDAPSSSVVAHSVASRMSSGNPVAAVVGALGDGANLDDGDVSGIVEETVESGAEREEGARLVGENIVEKLAYSTHPFTRLSGDYEAAREFVDGLDEDDFPTAVVLLALTEEEARSEAVAELVGGVYRLPSGVYLHELSRYIETCAVSGKHGLALSLCLDPVSHLEEARSVWRTFESNVIENVRGASVEEGEDVEPSFARVKSDFDTGAVADVLYDWVTGDVVVVNEDGDASFRAETFDCGRVAREAARLVDGEGGGHKSRADASFDVPRDEFIGAVRRVL